MLLDEMFICKDDTETHRTCGYCEKVKPVEDFYKDGKDANGKTRYRRDCKLCYQKVRAQEAKMKRKKGGKL